MQLTFLIFLIRPVMAQAARQALRNRLSSRQIRKALKGVYRQTDDLPIESTLGANIMVRFASITAGMYQQLIKMDFSPTDARVAVSQMTERVYERVAKLPWKLTRLIARNRIPRMKRAMSAFRKFPYGEPGYRMTLQKSTVDAFAFDVERCPVAEYFSSVGLPKLCQSAFCDLDFPLAEEWGLRLERPDTLAAGAQRCNFKYTRIIRHRIADFHP